MKIISYVTFVFLFLLLIVGCSQPDEQKSTVADDLSKVIKSGKLTAISGYNAYSYFIYKGQPMGFEYELLKRLADSLDVELEILIEKDVSKMFELLKQGKGDIIAYNLTVTKERRDHVQFTKRINTTKQVLVQRKPNNWRQMTLDQIDDYLIRNQIDLENKTIYVKKNSAHHARIKNLSEEIGELINIVAASENQTSEDLIRMVAEGEIDFTIADENVARLNQAYYSVLDVETDISLPQKIAWAVDKNSKTLVEYLDNWIRKQKNTNDFYTIYNRYYKNRRAYKKRVESKYFALKGGNISEYDEQIKEFADSLGYDWRIIASQIYQESQFDPNAKSWAGAKGLMQIMPITARQYKIKNPFDPQENLEAGFTHLLWLNEYWSDKIEDHDEKLKFILASYNIGLTHIEDSRKLAEKYGADPNLWEENVAKYLLLKSQKKYYNDELVKAGYCRGTETVKYVNEIFERFEHYKKFIS